MLLLTYDLVVIHTKFKLIIVFTLLFAAFIWHEIIEQTDNFL